MSHWAEIDKNNKVIRVLVGNNDESDEGEKWFKDNLGGKWVQTSYNSNKGIAGFSKDPGPNGEHSWYYGFTTKITEVNKWSTAAFLAETYNPGTNPHLRFVQGGFLS